MKYALAVVGIVVGCAACANDEDTIRTLRSSGYTDIRTTGWSPMSCGKDDTFETGFSAVNPAGIRVNGVVCCGLVFKGCTVRF